MYIHTLEDFILVEKISNLLLRGRRNREQTRKKIAVLFVNNNINAGLYYIDESLVNQIFQVDSTLASYFLYLGCTYGMSFFFLQLVGEGGTLNPSFPQTRD